MSGGYQSTSGWRPLGAFLVAILLLAPILVPASGASPRFATLGDPALDMGTALFDSIAEALPPVDSPVTSSPPSEWLRDGLVGGLDSELAEALLGRLGRSSADVFAEALERITAQQAGTGMTSLHVVDSPEETTLTGVVYIDSDWLVKTPLRFENADVVFRTANGRHAIVTDPNVTLTIVDSTIRQVDGRRDLFGTITARGPTTIMNSWVSEVMVKLEAVPGFLGEESRVLATRFDNAITGLTLTQNAVVDRSVFTRSYEGLRVEYSVPLSGTPSVYRSTFEMNEKGLRMLPRAGGVYGALRAGANAIGVECLSNGDQDTEQEGFEVPAAIINGSNVAENYGDAFSGANGVTIAVPGTELEFTFPDSRCRYDGNYFGGSGLDADSTFKGVHDTVVNTSPTPRPMPDTPAYPWPLTLITTTKTWSTTSPPPALTGPVVVKFPGALTVTNLELDPRGFTIGSKVNGSVDFTNVDITGRTTLYVRNTGDEVNDVEVFSEVLFNGVWSHRANTAIQGFRMNSGAPNGFGIYFWTALYTGDSAYVRSVEDSEFSNLAGGIKAQVDQPALRSNRFQDVNTGVLTFLSTNVEVSDSGFLRGSQAITTILGTTPVISDNVATARSDGLQSNVYIPAKPSLEPSGVEAFYLSIVDTSPTITGNNVSHLRNGIVLGVDLGTTTLSFNEITRTQVAVLSTLSKVSSDHNVFDRGRIGFLGAANAAATFAYDIFTNYAIGMKSYDLAGPTISSSLFAFNHIGVIVSDAHLVTEQGPPHSTSISGSNFIHNFGVAVVPWLLEKAVAMTVTCTNCWKEADESMVVSGTSTYSLAPNVDVPEPSWWDNRIIASTDTALSGELHGPAVAVQGARIRIADTKLDMNGFAVGAKRPGPSGAEGRLEVLRSDVSDGGFFGTNSTSALFELNRFSDFKFGQVLASWWNHPTVRCNAFLDVEDVVTTLNGNPSSSALSFERNLVLNASTLTMGETRSLRSYQESAVLTGNGFINLEAPVKRLGRGTLVAGGNAFIGGAGLKDYSRTNITAPQPDLANNFWGDERGPTVIQQRGQTWTTLRTGSSVILSLGNDGSTPLAIREPFLTALPSVLPCSDFEVLSGSATELDTLAFADRSFDPLGGPLERSWDFGDGSPIQVTTSPDVSHRFLDGGDYTVTLTVTTATGAASSSSRQVSIAHVDPIADFAASIVNEVTPVQFTDLSSHPNENDVPPAGWSYSWWFNGEGTSSAREPSFRFIDGGSKLVRLTVRDNDNRESTKQATFTVPHVAPTPSFTFDAGEETRAVIFTDTSTHPNAPRDGIASRWWTCTDGKTSSAASFSHRFADGGTYQCTLRVTDNDAQSATTTRSIPIGHVAPNVNYAYTGATELDLFAFTDTSTHPNQADAPPTGWTWAWDFGDGGTSAARHPTRTFADGGTRSVKLTATDNDGVSAMLARDVAVSHVPPVAAFSLPADPQPNVALTFTDLSTHPKIGDTIVTWAWSFGDGSTSAERNPMHTYGAISTYVVSLTVTDDDGLTSTVAKSMRVGNHAPLVNFTWSPDRPDALTLVNFTDTSSDLDGTVEAWWWTFGPDQVSPERHPIVAFHDHGPRDVCLEATDNEGKSSTVCKTLIIDDQLTGYLWLDYPMEYDKPISGKLKVWWNDGRPAVGIPAVFAAWLKTNYYSPPPAPPPDCGEEDCPWTLEMSGAPYYHEFRGPTDSAGEFRFEYYEDRRWIGSWEVQSRNVPGPHQYRAAAWTSTGYLSNYELVYLEGEFLVSDDVASVQQPPDW